MDDTFETAFESFSEESERRLPLSVRQEVTCKAMGVLRRLLARL